MFLRSLFTLILTVAMISPAFAEGSGVYGGIKFIDSYQTNWGGGRYDGTESQNSVGLGAFIGYDMYASSDTPIRVDIEYAFRSAFKGESNETFAGQHIQTKLEYNLHTLLANAYYDFHNDSIFTPYVGGGLGIGMVDGYAELNGNGNQANDTVFAWQVGGGVGVALTDALTADLGYRYLGTSTVHSEVDNNKFKTDISSHEFSVGIRFGF